MNRLLYVFALAIFLVSSSALAEIKTSDLGKKVVLTEEALLLQQVDTVSLYLSSDRVAFAPRLGKDHVIEVETTLLDPSLISKAGEQNSYVSRLIGTFVSVLKERLPQYAPAIASKFDPNTDLSFIVNAGAARVPVGVLTGGAWAASSTSSLGVSSPNFASAELNEARANEAEVKSKTPGRKGCNCPARR